MKKTIIFLLGVILMLSLVSAGGIFNRCERTDVNSNGIIDNSDMIQVRIGFGLRNCNDKNNWCDRRDVDRDSRVTIWDMIVVRWMRGCSIVPVCQVDVVTPVNECSQADLNGDGRVNLIDFAKANSIAQKVKSFNGCM